MAGNALVYFSRNTTSSSNLHCTVLKLSIELKWTLTFLVGFIVLPEMIAENRIFLWLNLISVSKLIKTFKDTEGQQ